MLVSLANFLDKSSGVTVRQALHCLARLANTPSVYELYPPGAKLPADAVFMLDADTSDAAGPSNSAASTSTAGPSAAPSAGTATPGASTSANGGATTSAAAAAPPANGSQVVAMDAELVLLLDSEGVPGRLYKLLMDGDPAVVAAALHLLAAMVATRSSCLAAAVSIPDFQLKAISRLVRNAEGPAGE